MAGNLLPLVLVGGALFLLGGKKKKKKSKATTDKELWDEFQEQYGPGGSMPPVGPGQVHVGPVPGTQEGSPDECDPLDPSTWGSGNMCVPDGGRWVRVPAAAPTPPAGQPDQGASRKAISHKKGEHKGDSGYVYGWYAQEYRSAPLWEWWVKRIPPGDEGLFAGCESKTEAVELLEYVRGLMASGETDEEGAFIRLSSVCVELNEEGLRNLLENARVTFDGYEASGASDSYFNASYEMSAAIYQSELALKG